MAIIIKNYIQFDIMSLFDSLNLELLSIKIQINKNDLIIVSYYNPPEVQLSENVFNILSRQKNDFLIIGDLNAKSTVFGCTNSNSNGSVINKIICEHDCIILNNNEHTYFNFNGSSSDILDLAISSSTLYDAILNFEVLIDDEMTSDHTPIVLELKNSTVKNKLTECQNPGKANTYNYNKADWNLFKRSLPKSAPIELTNDEEKLNDFVVHSLLNAANLSILRKP